MPMELSFTAAVIVGLLGSSHCLGMCGGIVAALNMGVSPGLQARPRSLFTYHLAYNLGRIGSYVLVGLLAGSLGAGLTELGVSPLAGRLFAAFFMIALGLYLANWWRGLAILEQFGAHLWRHIQPFGQRLLPVRNPLQAFLLGGLWGWLPCGLVYAVVAWSLTTSSAVDAAILMLGFGLGTLPALMLAGNAFNYLRNWVRAPLVRRMAGVTVMAFGIYSGISGFAPSLQHQHHASAASLLSPGSIFTELMRVPAILRRVG